LRGIVREHMTSEALEAQQPEDEAYARFIQTAVNGIVCATQLGRHRQAIEDLSTVLDFGLPPTVRRADQPRISTDILQGVVEQLAVPSPTE
jgi:hypothetical protein